MTDYPDYTLPVVHVGAITVEGSVSILGTVEISGSVVVSGAVEVTNTVTVTGSVVVSGTVSISGTVTVSGSVTVSGTVSISGTVTVSGAVTVSGTVGISGTVTVSGTVSISGTVTISGAVSVTGTVTISGAVTITSGAVTISTSGGANILIDVLTQAATNARSFQLANYGAPTGYAAYTGANRAGKFYPRGCRGFLLYFAVGCKDNGSSGGTITMYVSPAPGLAAVYSAAIAVAAGGAYATRFGNINRFWHYDSMFIWFLSSTADMQVGYDETADYDALTSADSGVTWASQNRRYVIRANMYVGSAGDLPVSGTINTIAIPNSAGARQYQLLNVGATSELLDTIQVGAGETLVIVFYSSNAAAILLQPRVYCDGVSVLPFDFALNQWFSVLGYVASATAGYGGSCFYVHWDSTNTNYVLLVCVKYPFKRSLQIGYYNPTAGALSAYVAYSFTKIS